MQQTQAKRERVGRERLLGGIALEQKLDWRVLERRELIECNRFADVLCA
jgi:hypothetical protein